MKTGVKMNKLIIAICCILTVTAGSIEAKDWKEVRIAVNIPYEPFQYRAPDGSLTGFEIDLGNAVCTEIKAKCEWLPQSWDGMIPGLLARKYDAIMSSMAITEERAKRIMFSEAYLNSPSAWFAKKGMVLDFSSKDSLKGKKTGVQRGTLQDNFVSDNFGSIVEVKRYNTVDDLVLDLIGGRLDVVFIDVIVGERTITNNSDFETFGDTVYVSDGIGVAFRKRDKALANKFNKALEKLKNDGTYDKIMKKYFTYNVKI